MAYDNTNRGALFKNKAKEKGDNRPDYTGKIDVNGKTFRISAWIKESGNTGEKFMSLAIQEPTPPPKAPAPEVQPQKPFGDDDIPF